MTVRRIAVVGISGAGKSVHARALADATGLPLVHMDALFWRGNWQAVVERDYLARHLQLVVQDRWIIEGYIDGTMASRAAAADLVIWLDYAGPLCAWRVIRRWASHRRTARPELPPEARDRLSPAFLWTVFTRAERPAIVAALEGVDPAKVRRILRPSDLSATLPND